MGMNEKFVNVLPLNGYFGFLSPLWLLGICILADSSLISISSSPTIFTYPPKFLITNLPLPFDYRFPGFFKIKNYQESENTNYGFQVVTSWYQSKTILE